MNGENHEDEKPPILRIKKDAIVDRVYQYKREERLAHRSAPQEPEEMKGFLRGLFRRSGRRRGGLGSILAVIVVVLAAVAIFRYRGQKADTAEIEGYQAVLRALPILDSLSVSVTFNPVRKDRNTETAPLAVVRFVLSESGESLIVSQILSPEGDVFRGKMRNTGKEKTLTAEVRVNDSKRTLSVALGAAQVKP
jgi:hypothetical protein